MEKHKYFLLFILLVVYSCKKLEGIPPSGIQFNSLGSDQQGSFIDSRDGTEYGYVKFNDLLWMTSNLNYKKNAKFGVRPTSSEFPQYSSSMGAYYKHDSLKLNYATICPQGWRLPNQTDIDYLLFRLGGREKAGLALISKSLKTDYPDLLTITNSSKLGFLMPGYGIHNYISNTTEYYYVNEIGYTWFTQNNPTVLKNLGYLSLSRRFGTLEVIEPQDFEYLSNNCRCVKMDSASIPAAEANASLIATYTVNYNGEDYTQNYFILNLTSGNIAETCFAGTKYTGSFTYINNKLSIRIDFDATNYYIIDFLNFKNPYKKSIGYLNHHFDGQVQASFVELNQKNFESGTTCF